MSSIASWYGINGEEGSQKSLDESRTFKSLKDNGDRGIVIEFRETVEIFEGKLPIPKNDLFVNYWCKPSSPARSGPDIECVCALGSTGTLRRL